MTTKRFTYESVRLQEIAVTYGPGWTGPAESYVETRAQKVISLQVMDALCDAAITALKLSELVKAKKAVYFMGHRARDAIFRAALASLPVMRAPAEARFRAAMIRSTGANESSDQ